MEFDLHFDLLQTITNNFSEEQKVGGGRFGGLYRGVYNGEDIAVKRLHPLQGLDDKAFDSELRDLSKVRHENVVRLIGHCSESRQKHTEHNGQTVGASEMERVLCFEYMHGGSLDKHISDDHCDLDWPTCHRIVKEICEGLNHLHNAQGKPIFHMDLKPANILLDGNMTAKIGDVGSSRLVSLTQTHETEIYKGTLEHMPPDEYTDIGRVSKKFDVYSLGVIILKIMAGNIGYLLCREMPQEQFIELVAENWSERLHGTSRYSPQVITDILRVKTCAEIALRCVQADRTARPSIKEIINKLGKLEAGIKKTPLFSHQSKELLARFDHFSIATYYFLRNYKKKY